MSNDASAIEPGRPIVLRGGTVLTMNDAHDVHRDADVLIVGEHIAGVGPGLHAPEHAVEIDASGGIVMPGMIDTHRHMWQTALRGYGADWTLTHPYLDNDTIGAVKPALVRPLTRHEDAGERARRGLSTPFLSCEFDIRLAPARS